MPKKIQRKTIEQFIHHGLEELIRGSKASGKKPKKSYLDKYKIKLRKKHLDTALRPVFVKDKYRKFLGATTKPGLSYGPANADGMASGLSSGGEVGDAGFGVGGWGATAFGESINRNAKAFLSFVDRLRKKKVDQKTITGVAEGYKAIFADVEERSTAILCGFQPSLKEHMTFAVEDLVFAINNHAGEIISVHVGEVNGMEPVSVIKRWYREIGVDDSVVNSILFVEKATPEIDESMLDIPFNVGKGDCISSTKDCETLLEPVVDPILIGCADLFFLPDLMVALSKQGKKFQVDRKFMFLI